MTDTKSELKRQTIGFTPKGVERLKELSKKHGVSQFALVDALVRETDDTSPFFSKVLETAKETSNVRKKVSKEISQAVSDVTQGMTPEEVVALLQKAKSL